jgi:AcrR family transcriptional regulator
MSSDSPAAIEKPPAPRERILQVAGTLFYREGYRAIGIDRVIAEAEVAKATFYKHFPSKDDLIVAWIARAEEWSATTSPPEDAPDALTAFAGAMLDIAGRPGCLGCTYQSSAAEFGDPAHPAHKAAIGVKQRLLDSLERRARAEGLAAPRAKAERVFLFLEGVWASVRMFGAEAPLGDARAAIRDLIA